MKYLNKIKNKDFIDKLFWRSLQIFGRQGLGFLIFLLLAYFLTPEEYGRYVYVFTVVILIITFCDFGFSAVSAKYASEYNYSDREKLEQLLFNIFILIGGVSSVVIIGFFIFGKIIFGGLFDLILLIIPIVFFAPIISLYDGLFRGVGKFKKLTVIVLSTGLVNLILTLIFTKYYGIKGALISQTVYYFIAFVISVITYGSFKIKYNKKIIKEVAKYSVIVGISSVAYLLYSRIDVVFLGNYGYIKEIAYYEIANKILTFVMLPFSIIASVISPIIARYSAQKDFNKIYQLFIKILKYSSLLSFSICICVFIFNNIFLQYIPKYNSPVLHEILNLMTIVFFSQMLNEIFPIGFVMSTGHAKLSSIFLFIFGLANVLFDYIFINVFGFIGIIYSTILVRTTADLLFIYTYYKILKKLK